MSERAGGVFRAIRLGFFRHGDGESTTAAVAGADVRAPGLHAYREPGPFDEPPSEPVELDADALPWELRDDAAQDRDVTS